MTYNVFSGTLNPTLSKKILVSRGKNCCSIAVKDLPLGHTAQSEVNRVFTVKDIQFAGQVSCECWMLYRVAVVAVVDTEETKETQAETGGRTIIILRNMLIRRERLKLRDNWRTVFVIGLVVVLFTACPMYDKKLL